MPVYIDKVICRFVEKGRAAKKAVEEQEAGGAAQLVQAEAAPAPAS